MCSRKIKSTYPYLVFIMYLYFISVLLLCVSYKIKTTTFFKNFFGARYRFKLQWNNYKHSDAGEVWSFRVNLPSSYCLHDVKKDSSISISPSFHLLFSSSLASSTSHLPLRLLSILFVFGLRSACSSLWPKIGYAYLGYYVGGLCQAESVMLATLFIYYVCLFLLSGWEYCRLLGREFRREIWISMCYFNALLT